MYMELFAQKASPLPLRCPTHSIENIQGKRALVSVHGCLFCAAGIQDSSDIYLWWILWISSKQIQNEKEPIRLASDKGKGEARGGYFVFVWGVLIDF